MGLASLQVTSLAIHLIQKSTKKTPTAPVLSEALTPLTDTSRAFLEDRLREAVKRARPVVEDDDLGSKVPGLVRKHLTHGQNLIDTSRELAVLLQLSQAGVSPPGLLLVADGTLDGSAVLVIAKLEHERGARAQQTKNAEGKLIYGMEFLQDLFFTTGSRVYKVAIFPVTTVAKGSFAGSVVDRQSPGYGVAEYFIGEFLGCAFAQRSDVLTETFHNAAQSFIDSVPAPATKARYQVALLSEMMSNKGDLSVSRFAQDYLDTDDRDAFAAHMTQKSVSMGSVPKDVTLVKSHLRRVQLEFAGDTWLLAPPRELEEGGSISISEVGDGKSKVEIVDRVTRVSGSGSVKPASGSESTG